MHHHSPEATFRKDFLDDEFDTYTTRSLHILLSHKYPKLDKISTWLKKEKLTCYKYPIQKTVRNKNLTKLLQQLTRKTWNHMDPLL